MMDLTVQLPQELVEKIISFLHVKDIGRFSKVSVSWREAANKDPIWLHECMAKGWLRYGVNNEIINACSLPRKDTNVSLTSPVFSLFIPEDTRLSPLCKWKDIFIRVQHLSKNWAKGRYTVGPILRGHKQKVSAIACNGTSVVSGSDDKILIIWDLATCTEVKTLHMHSDSITSLILRGNTAITGCADSAIRVIDTLSGQIIFTLMGHAGSIDHLGIVGNSHLISAATDKTVRVWSLPDRQLKCVFRDHTDEIECLCCHGNFVLTGSWDKTMFLWDIIKEKQIHKFEGHEEVVSCCQFDDNITVSGSADCTLRIWSTESGECNHTLEGHNGEVYCLVYNKELIASGSQDSTIRLWSHTGKCLHVLTGHLGVVRCLHINSQRLVSGGDQKKIGIWDYRTGKLMNMVHRNPTRLHLMWVSETKLVTASPEQPGTITVMSYW
ncbi:F-box/WD repeat-containing protein 7-like [Pecten maximus]|uniref:F-box/WD repeat-containing protein 7-like n=1 Tax=Pecten maximus TaxID=6579 RepID=UPI0014589C9F|nr:F-box/WD repeat-containing protein 7-like [Pecten maximus]